MKAACTAMLALVALGCSAGAMPPSRPWRYVAAPPRAVTAPALDRPVAVLPFTDGREDEDYDSTWLVYVPLVPFATGLRGFPEGRADDESRMDLPFAPLDDFALAAAQEIHNYGAFREAYFTDRPRPGDLVLEGRLQRVATRRTLTAYGLSFLGLFPVIFGAPIVRLYNEVAAELKLVDPASGSVLWSGAFDGQQRLVVSIHDPDTGPYYDRVLQRELARLLPGLEAAARESARAR